MNDDIELIDTTVPPVSGEVETVAAGGRSVLAVAVGLALVTVVLLSVIGGDDESAMPPAPRVPIVDTVPRPELSVDVTAGTVTGDGPVLAGETGLSLAAGGVSTPFRVLDLDSGDLVVSDVSLTPRFLVGSDLIHLSEGRSWARSRLDDLGSGPSIESEPSRFRPSGEPAHVVSADERDQSEVWLTWPRADRRRDWQLIELATSSVLREVTTPVEARILGGDAPFTGPEVIGFTTGGVHELLDDGTYRQVLEGRLVAVGRSEVLVRQCLPGSACTLRWFERGTWTTSDRPRPEGDLVSGRLVANERLLAGTVGRPAFGAGLYDVESGEHIRSLGPIPLGDVEVSPDGVWLLRRLFGRVEVVDIATAASVEIPGFPLGGGDSVIWLESS